MKCIQDTHKYYINVYTICVKYIIIVYTIVRPKNCSREKISWNVDIML